MGSFSASMPKLSATPELPPIDTNPRLDPDEVFGNSLVSLKPASFSTHVSLSAASSITSTGSRTHCVSLKPQSQIKRHGTVVLIKQ